MRILLASFGTRGDVQPFFVLAHELRRRGHEPVFAVPPDFTEWLNTHGFEAHGVGSPYRALVERHGANVFGGIPALRREFELQFDAFGPLVDRADLVLASGLSGAPLHLAERRGTPYRFVALSPSLLPSRAHPAPSVRSQALPGWMNAASWTLHEALWSAFFRGPTLRRRAALGLVPPRDFWAGAFAPEAFVATDPLLAPVPPDATVAVRQFGGVFFDDPTPLPSDVERFLSAGPPPVYVGFGSMVDEDPARTTRLLVEATRRAGVRVLVSRGWAGLDASPSADIHVVGDASHALLFPRCAAIVHHGGSGTTHAAARAGVPQLVVPHLLDQYFWGGRVQTTGLGPPAIARTRITARTLADALQRLVHDEALRERARRFAGSMVQDGVVRLADAVERLR